MGRIIATHGSNILFLLPCMAGDLAMKGSLLQRVAGVCSSFKFRDSVVWIVEPIEGKSPKYESHYQPHKNGVVILAPFLLH